MARHVNLRIVEHFISLPEVNQYNNDKNKLESIQRRAARWVFSNYRRTSSVSSMLQQLSWPSLQIR